MKNPKKAIAVFMKSGDMILIKEDIEFFSNCLGNCQKKHVPCAIMSSMSGDNIHVMIDAISHYTEVELLEPEVKVEEREDGAKITVNSNTKSVSVDFKDDDEVIKNLLIHFTEEILSKALEARKSL